ncbi:YybH family protein [Actinoplanes subtropicus]|uniref:YybH family protein n=1 Tax=Actinoplanes subtropicus TaxID=543632 RepID=UPI0006910819|nr:hypothetical protein [Actinoplanes subtropicus]
MCTASTRSAPRWPVSPPCSPTLTPDIRKEVEAGDIATVLNAWTLEGTGPDGTPLRLTGTSADVLRRRADGTWGLLIDDPWGA